MIRKGLIHRKTTQLTNQLNLCKKKKNLYENIIGLVFIRLPTQPECGTRSFYSKGYAWIETHARWVQKLLSLIAIPLRGTLNNKQSTQSRM